MRDDFAFAYCLVMNSSPDFEDFATFFKEYRNRLNALPIPDVLTVHAFRQHFHDLMQRILSVGAMWKVDIASRSLLL
ncbi:hypothetical protein TNCT_429581 [Trichonephila clavata]|uniref:Uncharacterized protein n=1 Tax=Trichonephila clavata TaxID=2740835 RepID=A0A8X6FTR0_TRICU|nr:hypothetical protein TNCT_429581 [Trichonephila clavata]